MAVSEPTDSQYRALLDISKSIALHRDLASRLRAVVRADGVIIRLHDAARNTMRAHVTAHPSFIPAFARGTPIPMEGTTGGVAFTTGRPVFINKPDFERFNSEYASY
jgi:hypothetical protein